MMSRKINWARLSSKYAKLAEEMKHDADRLRYAGVAPVGDDLRRLSDEFRQLAETCSPVGRC
jgi:hypothetical protein